MNKWEMNPFADDILRIEREHWDARVEDFYREFGPLVETAATWFFAIVDAFIRYLVKRGQIATADGSRP